MTQQRITLWSYPTRSVETDSAIRQSLAFDLRDIDLRGRSLAGVTLRLPRGSRADEVVTVTLSDPDGQVPYGRCSRRPGASSAGQIMLTPEAVSDLQQASGSFFSVEAKCANAVGRPARLARPATLGIRVVALAGAEPCTEVA